MKDTLSRTWLAVTLVMSLVACNEEDTAASPPTLPTSFGDCGAQTCEVSLVAFDEHCGATLDEALTCGTSVLETGVCGDLQGVRSTYAAPGDHYVCIYDTATKKLVGAVWQPDSHPRQIAGEQLPSSCTLSPYPCPGGGDGGIPPEGGDGGGLPDSFGDCDGSDTCEVSLAAFTKNPGTIPYCEASLATAIDNIDCTGSPNLTAGSCDGLYAVRNTYGFPGDNFVCVYDESSGALVGAVWTPDNHPRQIAGTQLPDTCQLTENLCPDGGMADAATD